MTEYLVTLSLLILAVLFIRGIFRKTVSPRVIYALWLVVVIRMLVPISLFQIDVALPDFPREMQSEQTEYLPEDTQSADPSADTYEVITDYPPITVPDEMPEDNTVTSGADTFEVITPEIPTQNVTGEPATIDYKQIADLIWFSGATITAAFFLLTGITYIKTLYKDRKLHRTVCGKKVYISEGVGVPCIAGIIPSIYITPETANTKSESLILTHEYVHIRHGDHIWSIVRVIALIVFWYNPLVWIAANVSKRDAELACDDTVSSKLSDDGRLEYANILLDTIPQNHRHAVGLGSAPIKERILMLTKKHKNRFICLILAVVLALSAVGCAFVSLNDKNNEQAEATLPDNFEQIYHEAERVYSLFTGYRDNIYTDSTFSENGADYRSVDINGYTTLDELRSYCEQYFSTELTDELMSITASWQKYPLFIEHEGMLFSFDGFVALYGYDVGSDYKMTPLSCEDDVYTVKVEAVMHEGELEISASANCTFKLGQDGEIRFTSFELMAEKLLDALEQIPVDTIPVDTDPVDTLPPDPDDTPEDVYTFEYKGVKYDLSEIYSGVNGVFEWGHIGKYVVAWGHVNPNMGIFAFINPETQKIEHSFAGCIATYHGEDINTFVYTYWNTVKAFDGTVLAELELSNGEYIRGLEYADNNTKIIVTIDAEDSPRTVTIDLSPSEDTGSGTTEDNDDNVLVFTSPNGRYSVKFYKIEGTIYPESGTYFLPCDKVSIIDNQTHKEIVTGNTGYMFPSPDITAKWSSDSKYCSIVVGDSRYASWPLFFDTSRAKIFGTETIKIAQTIENESQRPVKSVLYSSHEKVLEFLGDDKVKIRSNFKVGSASDDKYVIAEYLYSLSSQEISELTYTFSENYYQSAAETVTAALDKIMEGYGKYSTPAEYAEAYPSECSAILALGKDGVDALTLEVVKYDTATSDMERTRCLIARYISDKMTPGRYSVLTVGKKYKIIARVTQIISSADESPDFTDISLCYADSDEALLTLNGPFYDGRFYWSNNGNYVIIASGKDTTEASIITCQNRRHFVLPKDEIFEEAAKSLGKNAKLLSISTDYGIWKDDSCVEIKYDMSVRDNGKTYRIYGTYTYNISKHKVEKISFNGMPNGVTNVTLSSTAQSCTTTVSVTTEKVKSTVDKNLDILISANLDANGQLINSDFRQNDYINANKAAFNEIVALGESAFEYLKEIGNGAFEYNITPAKQARCILARVALHKIRPSFYDCTLQVMSTDNQSKDSRYFISFTAVDFFDLMAPEGERSIGYKVTLYKDGKAVCSPDKELGYLSNPSAAGNLFYRWSERYLIMASAYGGMYDTVDVFDLQTGEFIDLPDIPELSAMFTSPLKVTGFDGKEYDKLAIRYAPNGSNIFKAELVLNKDVHSPSYTVGYYTYDLEKRELLSFDSLLDG